MGFRTWGRLLVGVCVVASAIGLALLASPAEARTAEAPNPFTTLAGRDSVVLFVPLDRRARTLLTATVPNVKRYLSLPAQITAIPASRPSWRNKQRQQVDGRAVLKDLMARYRSAQGSRPAFLVLVSSGSLYDTAIPALNFVFGLRASSQEGRMPAAAAVGTANMRIVQPAREQARLTKMMLRYTGEVVCGLPRNADPKSVLYSPIVSCDDLDRMAAKLPRRC
jgi:hypothetical protein